MCLIVVGWRVHPDYPLVVAANRDEFHGRASLPAAAWPDDPAVFGGRDLTAGGTWLGLRRGGRFAAVTNVREPGKVPGKCSRGALTAGFLRSTASPEAFCADIVPGDYAGFNLLVGDGQSLAYVSNRDPDGPRVLSPGIYGLSNHRLQTPWPKLRRARTAFASALEQLPACETAFALLADRRLAADAELPDTGVSLAWERLLSAIFVCSPDYGTRASTLALQRSDGSQRLIERSFSPDGSVSGEVDLEIPA
ncbi:NRDE family protein [Azonexus sp. R2A61]|uniref:NRDE family protein n=1 Tax=Azonexus sp. R2A61 TaxID=2744443 RepID=UPI001F48E14A|nr:NRDE family protein [Azonexus sp. R2A61]